MSYWLGIDVGSTFIVAAICREEAGRRAWPELVPLGGRSALVSSVVYLGPDGQVVVWEAAERRAVTDPDRVVRECKRRIGDDVPMVIGGVSHSASEIAALVVGWVVERVAQRENGPAQGITITHPARWGTSTIQAMADVLRAGSAPRPKSPLDRHRGDDSGAVAGDPGTGTPGSGRKRQSRQRSGGAGLVSAYSLVTALRELGQYEQARQLAEDTLTTMRRY